MKKTATIPLLLLAAAILSAVIITALDKGNSTSKTSGAGDIWWVDVPEVEQNYQQLMQK